MAMEDGDCNFVMEEGGSKVVEEAEDMISLVGCTDWIGFNEGLPLEGPGF